MKGIKQQIASTAIEVQEDIERHNELNSKFFDADQLLRAEVREKIMEIIDTFVQSLAKSDIELIIDDVIILGSNASYNYTKDSDLDLHIVAKTAGLDYPPAVYDKLYSAYRSLFNNKFDIKFFGAPVEIYVETEGTPRVTSGIYSVLKDQWLKKPVLTDIPEVDEKAIKSGLKIWEARATDALKTAETTEELEDLINEIYQLRADGLKTPDGEYSTENLIFKELRNHGVLDELKDLKTSMKTKELSLEALSAQKAAYKAALKEHYRLTERERVNYMQTLSRLAHTQVLVNTSGHFQAHNLPAREAENFKLSLQRLPWVCDISAVASGYDFSRPERLVLAGRLEAIPQKYTVSGRIKPVDPQDI